jgi:hypothetical protein
MGKLTTGLLAAALIWTCAACGPSGSNDPRGAAEAFEHAIEADDGAGACALLAPRTRSEVEQSAGKPCAEAILEEDLPEAGAPTGSSAYGTMGQVRFADDTLFMAEFESGWRVTAAGCAPKPPAAYECAIQGG